MSSYNPCAPMSAYSISGEYIQGKRKGAFGELFIMYLIYLGIKIYYNIKNKGNYDQNIQQKGVQDESGFDIQVLERFFSVFFGYHVVALGIAILWAPFDFTLAITYIHLISFIVVIVSYNFKKPKITSISYAFCQIINLALIITGLVGITLSNGC